SHSDVEGNERVDREAKLAAQGKQNNTATLLRPDILRRPLPISKSKLKQAIKEEAKSTSRAIWEASPRHDRIAEFDESYPFKEFHKLTDKLSRYGTAILVQARTGHLPTSAYLHKRKLADTYKCTRCRAGHKETLNHITRECAAYTNQRCELRKTLKGDMNSPKLALGDPIKAAAIVEFLVQTGRFKKQSRSENLRNRIDPAPD
ncbi:hypothetical protein FA15DRAFT_715880, partial [Coprinopsis marcescibilis]